VLYCYLLCHSLLYLLVAFTLLCLLFCVLPFHPYTNTAVSASDRPDPPSSVEVDRCRDDTAEIKWIKGIENNAPVNYFVVQYNTSFNPDQWVSSQTVEYSQNTANIELSPWVNYTFRVIATNKIGASVPSMHTTRVCTTTEDLPDKNPENIRAIGDTQGKLKIEWIVSTQYESCLGLELGTVLTSNKWNRSHQKRKRFYMPHHAPAAQPWSDGWL